MVSNRYAHYHRLAFITTETLTVDKLKLSLHPISYDESGRLDCVQGQMEYIDRIEGMAHVVCTVSLFCTVTLP